MFQNLIFSKSKQVRLAKYKLILQQLNNFYHLTITFLTSSGHNFLYQDTAGTKPRHLSFTIFVYVYYDYRYVYYLNLCPATSHIVNDYTQMYSSGAPHKWPIASAESCQLHNVPAYGVGQKSVRRIITFSYQVKSLS